MVVEHSKILLRPVFLQNMLHPEKKEILLCIGESRITIIHGHRSLKDAV